VKRKSTPYNKTVTDYAEILKSTQNYVSDNYSKEISDLAETNDKSSAKDRMKKIIIRSLINLGFYDEHDGNIELTAERLYEDMSGYGFLAKYLADPAFEEANINSWDCTYIQTKDKKFIAPESFLSPQHAIDVIKRIVANSGEKIDEAVPGVRASLSDNTRIIATIFPIVSYETGVSASIRRVNASTLTEQDLISSGTATPEIIDFLVFCISNGVSVCFAGETGSGKTTVLNWLLSKIKGKRIITIEEGSPEYENLLTRDENGKPTSDVVFLRARKKGSTPDQIITPIKLLDSALWMDPDIIVVGEMRSFEAYTAQEAARTGHTVGSTTHSSSAEDTYDRILTMAQLYPGNRLGDDRMMSLIVKAFPIVVYMKHRRIMEVMEGESYLNASGLKTRTLYRFNVESKKTVKGKAVVKGSHERVSGISERLARTLSNNEAEKKLVDKYLSFGREG
jgi:pilus assembly protein CpaF